ncbi:hypothetical protein LCGC14_3117650 [marine sediment metagenome]|uniref:Uncharacterized protein n=1 Tax=marine sediment metagenome TaxID=412755 RepID=A0A0F8YAN5_9ZZZZ
MEMKNLTGANISYALQRIFDAIVTQEEGAVSCLIHWPNRGTEPFILFDGLAENGRTASIHIDPARSLTFRRGLADGTLYEAVMPLEPFDGYEKLKLSLTWDATNIGIGLDAE